MIDLGAPQVGGDRQTKWASAHDDHLDRCLHWVCYSSSTVDDEEPPRVLFAATAWWPLSARLALRFLERGCTVSAVCPHGHPLEHTSRSVALYRYRRVRSLASLAAAVAAARPALVIPCDDRVVWQMHALHRLHPDWRPLIERSLGDPASQPIVRSRYRLLGCARELGIDVPDTVRVSSEDEVRGVLARWGGSPKAVLKIDGTWGGEGVRVVDSPSAAARAFRMLWARPGLSTALKRSIVNRDALALWAWGQRSRPEATLQRFVVGRPANAMVACWKGEVLGTVCVEVLSSEGPTGAAILVRLIESPPMVEAARRLIGRLGLSGFCGLDFMVDGATGVPHLIEMNPRCTQLGHLPLPGQGDLAGLLLAKFAGHPIGEASLPIEARTIAFFPQFTSVNRGGDTAPGVYHDVPHEAPELVAELLRPPFPDRKWLARVYHRFRVRRPVAVTDFPDRGRTPGNGLPRS